MNRSEALRGSIPPGKGIFELFSGNRDIKTVNQRPVSELAASPASIMHAKLAGQDMGLTQCYYPDSRFGGMMEFGAFRELSPRWQQLLDSLAWLSNEYFQGKLPATIHAQEITDINFIALVMPIFLTERGENPLKDGELPNVVGDVAKALRGVGGVVLNHMDKQQFVSAPDVL